MVSSCATVHYHGWNKSHDENIPRMHFDERLAAAMTASAVARRRHFEAAMQHCGVCLEYVPGAKFPPELPLCAHRPACASCFASLCATAVRSGDLTALRCPEQKCGKELVVDIVCERLGNTSGHFKDEQERSGTPTKNTLN